ncbi:hypothetical protein [Microbacterium sp. A93]|uniref:hypothetical protein n=1 Tax=unclassified Microbacterium TaxID=2609290 RepID=UPI003F41F46F
MNKLTRNISYWLLLVLSLASAAVGGWIITNQSTTMSTALLDGTATGVEVYVGQSLIVTGAVILGAGIIGLLLALALAAAKALLPATAPAVVAPIDWTAEDADASDAAPAEATAAATEDELATR